MGKRTLKFRLLTVPLLFCACFFAFAMSAIADEPPATTSTLEGLVAQWVDLRRALAGEAEAWEEQRAQLEQERALLSKAKETLEEEISTAEGEQRSDEAERAKLLARKQALQTSLNACLPALRRAEADLKGWRSLWPPSLLTPPLRKAFDQLLKAEQQSVTRRLQVILSLYGEIERLQYGIQVVKEVLQTGSGRSQEMDVLYLGLAQGFAVSVDDRMAGIGRPVGDDWKWEWRPEMADEVRKAIAFYRHEKTADFVHLPLMVKMK